MASEWSYLSNFAMRLRAMNLKPTPSGQPSARREFYAHGVWSFFERPWRRRRIIKYTYHRLPGSVDIISFFLLWHLCESEGGMRTDLTLESKCDKIICQFAIFVHVRGKWSSFRIILRNYYCHCKSFLSKLYESSRRKPGWRFTAGSE